MNYYTDSRNEYSMNNRNDDRYNNEYYYDDRNSKDYYGDDCDKNGYGHNKKSCCVRRVEETFCCFPSYYNEEKKEDKKEDKREKCFEGTFKICPKHYDYNDKEDCNKEKDYNDKNDCYDEKYNRNDNQKCCGRCHKRCGFCGLFGRW